MTIRAHRAHGLALALVLATIEVACIGLPPQAPSSSTTAGSTSTTSLASESTSPSEDGSTLGPVGSTADSTLTGTDTSAATDDGGSSSSTGDDTGEPSTVGCADGSREALLDELAYPNIAACAGGFGVPGVHLRTPQCERQGGDDGPLPDGMGCSIDDLCGLGWHVCLSQSEVSAAGMGSCDNERWSTQFFATGQSGQGSNTCTPSGTDDVYGCGDVGLENIADCSPLNRSTGNLCADLPGAWECDADAHDEASHLAKPGPTHGGALCCRDVLVL